MTGGAGRLAITLTPRVLNRAVSTGGMQAARRSLSSMSSGGGDSRSGNSYGRSEILAQRAALFSTSAPSDDVALDQLVMQHKLFRLTAQKDRLDGMALLAFNALFDGGKTLPVSWVQVSAVKREDAAPFQVLDDPSAYVRMSLSDGGNTSSSRAYDVATEAPWYQGIVADSLKPMLESVQSGQRISMNSVFTGPDVKAFLHQMREKGVKDLSLTLTDIEPSKSNFQCAISHVAEFVEDGTVTDPNFILLKGKDDGSFHNIASVGGCEEFDHVTLFSAVHLIPQGQLMGLFDAYGSVLKPGGTLHVGSANIVDKQLQAPDEIRFDDVFGLVRDRVVEQVKALPSSDPLKEIFDRNHGSEAVETRRARALPAQPSVSVVFDSISCGYDGWGPMDVATSTNPMGSKDGDFINHQALRWSIVLPEFHAEIFKPVIVLKKQIADTFKDHV
ncbi:MAG: hypothetical protein ACI9BD_000809 [Candidatus Marinamargulisbacteria bacterium]|jgi:hypothetical protein